jgi:hypothetical protein
MADRGLTTCIGFEAYLGARRDQLDDALGKAFSLLFEHVEAKDTATLMLILEAGKKLRGCLSCLVSDALGGHPGAAIPAAVAVEMVQAATLIHDDYVDQDTVRRGKPAVWTLEGARRAVLIGDLVFASAIAMMSDLGREQGSTISHAIAHVSKGALHEPLDPLVLAGRIESGCVNGQLYKKIIHLKTGVLFGAACRLGAIAAGAGNRFADISYRYGLRVGETYQVADDLMEIKEHLSSRIISPEQMAPLAPAFLHFSTDSRPRICSLLKGENMDLKGGRLELFSATAKSMEEEVEAGMQSAASEIVANFPENGYRGLAGEAPETIIRLLTAS